MTVMDDIKAALEGRLEEFDVCGFISRQGHIFPLGTDTKVLSTVFELVSRPMIVACADAHGYDVEEPLTQNYYPDFTLRPRGRDDGYVAIDVKTTYRHDAASKFSYTLGGYTSFIRLETPTKNIVYPFGRYREHWILGFVYTRVAERKAALAKTFDIDQIDDIVSPYRDVDFFLRQKWEVAGDFAGSGNTTNIGSLSCTIENFRNGAPLFANEEEFLAYWRGYGKTKAARTEYSKLAEFRALRSK